MLANGRNRNWQRSGWEGIVLEILKLSDFYLAPGSSDHRRDWQQRCLEGNPLLLDLSERGSEIASPTSVRFDTLQLILLANLLAGARSEVELEVRLPEHPSILRVLARTPLLSAIANHDGLRGADQLDVWRRIWNPNSHTQIHDMLSPASNSIGPIQDGLLTLTNPHRRSRSTVAREVRGIVDPWLNTRFVPHGRTVEQDTSLRDVERIMTELTENIADHAFEPSVARPHTSSCQMYTTRGGGRQSTDRFIIAVVDNGVGISKAVRRVRSDLNGMAAFRAAMCGQLAHSADRQWGLENVQGVVERNPGSKITVISAHREDRGHALLFSSARPEDPFEAWEWMPVRGTIVLVQLTLPVPIPQRTELFSFDDTTMSHSNLIDA